jgi:hypothetical protein
VVLASLLAGSACVNLRLPIASSDGGGGDEPGPAEVSVEPTPEPPADAGRDRWPDAGQPSDVAVDLPAEPPPDATVASDGPMDAASDAASDVPPTSLLDGLVGYWRLDDRSSALVADSSPEGNDGTVMGAPTLDMTDLPALKFSDPGAYVFAGASDAVVVPDSPSLRPAKISISAWVNLASQNARGSNCGMAPAQLQYIVHRRNTRSAEGNFEGVALMKESSGTFGFLLTTNDGLPSYAHSITLAQTGTWYHLVATFDGVTMLLYVNGALEGFAGHMAPIDYDPTRPLFIARTGECGNTGEATWDARFNGTLDDLRIYDRVLTVGEIARLGAGEQ